MTAAAVKESSARISNTISAELGYTRLHITPFDQALLPIVIPASVLPRARNASFHTVQTFPEKRYGFIDLPAADAENLRRKLNGSILKGSKMRIDKAKPESIPEPVGDDAGAKKEKKKKKPRDEEPRKRTRDSSLIEGTELHDRKVKRGWTTPDQPTSRRERKEKDKSKRDKKSKKQSKSKYTDGPELLFKAKLPAGATANADEDDAARRKRRKKGDRREVVHEFERTTKFPTFLKSASSDSKPKPVVEFIEGKGWVDAEGNVVEAVKYKTKAEMEPLRSTPKQPGDQEGAEACTTSSSDTSSDSDEMDDALQVTEHDEEDRSARDETPKQMSFLLSNPPSPEVARPKSSGSAKSLSIKIPPVTPAPEKVHPLEALYKRPRAELGTPAAAQEESALFSFFGDAAEDDSDYGPRASPTGARIPMTPFTRQDFESRNVRSAAPTPDTAHPSRMSRFWPSQDDVEEEEEEEEEEEQAGKSPPDVNKMVDEDEEEAQGVDQAKNKDTDNQTSDFQKLFWEQRGDLNRAWRKVKKTAAKEKRYRENKARGSRTF